MKQLTLHLNHSVQFWQRVAEFMPEYEYWRKWFKEHGGELRYKFRMICGGLPVREEHVKTGSMAKIPILLEKREERKYGMAGGNE